MDHARLADTPGQPDHHHRESEGMSDDYLQFEIENSQLDPADLDGFLPGPVTAVDAPNGNRGLAADLLIGGVVNGATAGAVSVVVVQFWTALRRHRERQLTESAGDEATISIEEGDQRIQIVVPLHGDGSTAGREVEVQIDNAGMKNPGKVHIRLHG
ncbi:DUF2062 domain-containing protein [Micromonospora sediminimaris]|uniref:Uncharacterized protein n=1 Tax=Micromonospora sediminimaris TaxID=547162 RepID=A0A9W5UTU9_9ACTN|nr:DUF2062 domain-containing protein [Micromonospora sediminimaris]GIJ34464.1 hypothetical protein Vse01_36120 [Micromonospora sediminimaris]SFD29688.1 hypothetical protein SAMN05216284_114137 [Micromonospora sediminimaris]